MTADPGRAARHGAAAPVSARLGARMERSEPGRAWVEFVLGEEFCIPGGPVQGGMVGALADHCMALAAYTILEPGLVFATSTLTVNLLAALRPGRVQGEGRVVRRGRSVIFLEATLHGPDGRACATATSVGTIQPAPPGAL